MKDIFGPLASFSLLSIYVYLLYKGVTHDMPFNDGMSYAFNTINGLISAIVIAELAITRTGEAPAALLFQSNLDNKPHISKKILSSIFLIVWILAGFVAFYSSQIIVQTTVVEISELGKSWIGLLVGAAYAYFGINSSD